MPKPKLKLAGQAAPTKCSIALRWTKKLVEGGWTPVSDYFLENYHRLNPPITTTEAMFIVHLMLHKWDEKPPYPGFKTLAKRMGITPTAARNHARSLDSGKHYIKRITRVGLPNKYDLTPLFDALEKLKAADDKAEQQKQSQKTRTSASA